MRTLSKCRASLALTFLRHSVLTLVRHVPRPGLTLGPGSPGVSEIAVDMYTAYSMKLSSTHNPHPDMESMNMLFKRLNANSMTFSDMQRGLILLNTILKEWSTVAQIYSQLNQPWQLPPAWE